MVNILKEKRILKAEDTLHTKLVPRTFFIFLVALAFSQGNFSVFAQSTSLYNDGSNQPTSSTTQWIRQYRFQSNEVSQKISALSSQVELSIRMPVLFGVGLNTISPNFGDPRSGGRTHLGEDIMALRGTPIVSPTKAVVLKTGVGTSEGLYVYTANPGGETYVYMHLDKIGERVVEGLVLEQGALIGYVGNTGNASGGATHLHFEVHNATNTPIDPFPRLTNELTLQEKMIYLATILSQTNDSGSLSLLLATNFKSTFTLALTQNISVPSSIQSILSSIADTPSYNTGTLPLGDLQLGSSGSLVVKLQQELIEKSSGPASIRLTQAKATGNFGPITQNALIEYQLLVRISPANGYYGSVTRAILESSGPSTIPPVTIPSTSTFTRNLYVGITGVDVRTLQQFLNKNGFTVAVTGSGSLGHETIYFGKATRDSVIRYQLAKGIMPALGYVGSITRGFLNASN